MRIHKYLFNILAILITFYCCNKARLNQPQLGNLEESDLSNRLGVEGLLIGAYVLLDGYSNSSDKYDFGRAGSNWIFGSICGCEGYKGGNSLGDQDGIIPIETFEATAFNAYVIQKWDALYDGIARANTVLQVMRNARDMTPSDTTEVRAEAVFLRAFYHFEAKKIWNNIQFVDEHITYGAANYQLSNDSGWSFIENDFMYAMKNLPAKQTAIGRPNKYAAEAFLAKAYLFEHKYQEARILIQDIINNGVTSSGMKYSLVQYKDNFHPTTKNNTESVFAAQMSVNDGSFGFNSNISDHTNYPSFFNDGWDFFHPSQFLVNHFKTDPVSGLPDLDHFNDSNMKSDQGISSDSAFTPYTGTLDPRLDWTVGRRGIPYLDFEIDPGNSLLVDPINAGPYIHKKNVIYKSEIAEYSNSSGPWGTNTLTANNINFIRFADVLLWAAEVEVEIGSLKAATDFVNMIRERAADTSGWVYEYNRNPATGIQDPSLGNSGTFAAKYYIKPYPNPFPDQVYGRKAVRFERMLELGMEGHRFFDLVRWGIADHEINAYLQKEQVIVPALLNGAFFQKGCNEYFPIPQNEISLSAGSDGKPKMIQNPCY